MTRPAKQTDQAKLKRRDRLIQELDHDPYHSKSKIKSPAVCPDCGAVYSDGRWTWKAAAVNAKKHVCPACQRISDRVPAAFLTIRGDFLAGHDDEVMHLIENYEARERKAHPMKRIIGREQHDGELVLTFSDAHLARGIGEALHRAYEGELDYEYTKGDIMLRVSWTR